MYNTSILACVKYVFPSDNYNIGINYKHCGNNINVKVYSKRTSDF